MLMAAPSQRRPDPTPAEIAALCREIQAGWTPEVRDRRRVCKGNAIPWTVPETEIYLDTEEQEFWFWVV